MINLSIKRHQECYKNHPVLFSVKTLVMRVNILCIKVNNTRVTKFSDFQYNFFYYFYTLVHVCNLIYSLHHFTTYLHHVRSTQTRSTKVTTFHSHFFIFVLQIFNESKVLTYRYVAVYHCQNEIDHFIFFSHWNSNIVLLNIIVERFVYSNHDGFLGN